MGPVCTSQLQAGPVIVLPVCTPEVEPPAPPAAPRADAPLLVDEAGDGIEGDLTVAGRPGVGTSSPSAEAP